MLPIRYLERPKLIDFSVLAKYDAVAQAFH